MHFVTIGFCFINFRKEFKQGTTDVGLPENMICTKKNTFVNQTYGFLFSLGSAKLGQYLWNLFPQVITNQLIINHQYLN